MRKTAPRFCIGALYKLVPKRGDIVIVSKDSIEDDDDSFEDSVFDAGTLAICIGRSKNYMNFPLVIVGDFVGWVLPEELKEID